MQFCITWVIFQQLSRRGVKLVLYFIIFHLLNYTSPLIPNFMVKWNKAYYEVELTQKTSFRCSWQGIAFRCVVTVNCGHFSCRHNSRIGFSKQNVYVNELNMVLLHPFRSGEFKSYKEMDVIRSPYFTEIMHVICRVTHYN